MPAFSCNRCFFWQTLSSGLVSGECRRSPPQSILQGLPHESVIAVYPITLSGFWCGSFQDLSSVWAQQMMQYIGRQ